MAWDGKPKNVIGPAVQKLRVARGWSQPELAAKCQMAGWDISRGIVAGIEGRMRWIGDWEALFLARLFRVSVDELYPERADLSELLAQARPDSADEESAYKFIFPSKKAHKNKRVDSNLPSKPMQVTVLPPDWDKEK